MLLQAKLQAEVDDIKRVERQKGREAAQPPPPGPNEPKHSVVHRGEFDLQVGCACPLTQSAVADSRRRTL